jgi:hypothetical protein
MGEFTKTCDTCGKEFKPYYQNISSNSPTCKDCLENELEKHPIMPKRIKRRD